MGKRQRFERCLAVATVVAMGCGERNLQPFDGGRAGVAGAGGAYVIITSAGGTSGGHLGMGGMFPNCGVRDWPAERLLPEILILLDASASMNDDLGNMSCGTDGCGATSKWAQLVPALNRVVAESENQVHWGLKLFGHDDRCSVENFAEVPTGAGNAVRIANAIALRTNAGGGVIGGSRTPTRAALDGATSFLSSSTSANPKYVLLATDGVANCASGDSATSDDAAGAQAAVGRALAAGFPVFVVGVATAGVVTNEVDVSAALDRMAIAGGYPRAGDPRYYPVMNAAELGSVFATVASSASTCTFQIGPPPTNDGTTSLSYIDVFADGAHVPRDSRRSNGWDYTDARQYAIAIYGPVCDAIQSGMVERVSLTFRCFLGG